MKNILLSILFIFTSAIVSNLYAKCELKNNEIIVAKKTSCDTITAGIELAQNGQTVKVLYGIYEENIVIKDKSISVIGSYMSNNGVITNRPIIKSLNKEIVNISGTKITLDGFEIKNADDFVEILNQEDQDAGRVGVKIEPGASDITILHNKFNYIGYKYHKNGQNPPIWCGEQAHAINAVSYDKEAQIKGVYIRSNEFSNLHQGKSEAVTLNGNLTGFEISDNRFWDIDNIAIDIAGYYDTCPEMKDGNSCQANKGQIVGNTIWNLLNVNPGQNKVYPTLAAIYIDGGRDVLVDRNEVHYFGVGLDFGSENGDKLEENKGVIDKVILSNNLIYSNKSAGIWIGHDDVTEKIENCYILNNTLVNNNTYIDEPKNKDDKKKRFDEGTIRFTNQQGIKNLTIANNIIYSDSNNTLITNLTNKDANGLSFLNNFFYSNNKDNFSGGAPDTFDDFLKKYGNIAERFEKVVFAPNYDLVKGSIVIDQGTSNYLNQMCKDLSKCYDLRGNPRISKNKIDVGAVEF